MPLSFTTNIGRANRTWKVGGGLKVAQVEMTVGATGDYASGYDLTGNASKMGFSRIFDVVTCSARTSAGTIRALAGIYDHNTGKLRFYKTGTAVSSGANTGLLQELQGAGANELAAGDLVRMTVIGV